MAQSWQAKQRAHETAMYRRLGEDLTGLAARIGQIVIQHATGRDASGQAIVPNRRTARDTLGRAVWLQALKPYFIGSGDDPLIGAVPQSPFMRLIVDGIQGGIRLRAERQVEMVRKNAPADVFRWLTGPRVVVTARELGSRGPRVLSYDPFHLFVNPNGYRLSDNGWNTALRVRAAIDQVLAVEIPRGTAAVSIAKSLEPFLWPSARAVRTKTPYGSDGSYWARRLARTEITAAAGRAEITASQANPYIDMLRWRLSASHPEPDICDDNAHGGPGGDGRYPKVDFPQYPAHPHCLCSIIPEVVRDRAAVTAELRQMMADARTDAARSEQARRLQGAFNLEWLVTALMYGYFAAEVLGVGEGAA